MNERLRLKNQLCFPLYVVSKALVRDYKPLLDELDLTYTQYITMIVIWEHGEICVKELGKCLHLDSGTLTPLLKKLIAKGYIALDDGEDRRYTYIHLTGKGKCLHDRAAFIPVAMKKELPLSQEETELLKHLLNRMMNTYQESGR